MLDRVAALLPGPLKALAERFDRSPIDSVETLTHFVQTRSAYVAQTALYGYLKTRMGTRYRDLFQDEVFAGSIRLAAIRVFVSSLGDLTVFAVAVARERGELGADEAAALARGCFDEAMRRVLDGEDPGAIPMDMAADFHGRVEAVRWRDAAAGENAFAGSAADLVRFAPVIDEFKELDSEIVSNSIRFRWRDVRAQFRRRVDGPALCRAWRRAARAAE